MFDSVDREGEGMLKCTSWRSSAEDRDACRRGIEGGKAPSWTVAPKKKKKRKKKEEEKEKKEKKKKRRRRRRYKCTKRKGICK